MGKLKSFIAKLKGIVWKHKIISIVAIIAICILAYLVFPKNTSTILTETVKKDDIVKTISITGKVDSDNTANLSFQTGGTLDYIGAKVGDNVKKGQLIASLNKDDLWATFRQAQQDFTAAKAASEQYYSGHTNATESYEEKVERTALDAAQNKAYDYMVKAQKAVFNYNLYSPIDGILTRTDADTTGVNVTALTVFTVTDPKSLVFKLEVDQSDIGQIVLGQKVKIVLDAFPDKTIDQSVDEIDFVSHITASGGTSYYVKSILASSSATYRVGMNGNADIIVASKKDVLVIPSSSIMDDNTVYRKMGDKYQKIKVTIGIQNDTQVEIVSELSEGEVVAIDPSSIPSGSVIN